MGINFSFALQPVNLIKASNFDDYYSTTVAWDTIRDSSGGAGCFAQFGFPDSTSYNSFPYSISIDARKDAEIFPIAGYRGIVEQVLLVPKNIGDLISFSWTHAVEYKAHSKDSILQYSISLYGDYYDLCWIYLNGEADDDDFNRYFKMAVPEENEWVSQERDIKNDMESKGLGSLNIEIEKIILRSRWGTNSHRGCGQKVYWDDIKLIGWADYDRALTRIISGIPEEDKSYKAEVMLWNNGRKKLDISKVEMVVIKDGVDTVFQDRKDLRDIESDDSVKVSFMSWTPTEDGNYRIEFYTGYLWGKYFGDELVIDECDDDDYLFMEFTLGVKENKKRNRVVRWLKQSSKYIEFEVFYTGYADISLYDIQGRRVDDIYSGYVNSDKSITYDWRDLSKGVYFIRAEMGDKSITEKVIKIR